DRVEVSGEKRGADVTEYALYKGEELLKIGTLDELAEFRKVKRETIFFYATPTYRKRTTEKGIRVIRLD
ncbi:hypothetical protein ARO12_15480, partial [Listeria monocytogenes]|nr:hypothetical protein [Listeria monocytogenes]EAC5570779.1 hypothetical protein [Listeria monocytogenes]EAD0027455.1 hypothetical protein [Listeria monocytogenes]EAD0030645.1 hypothetical protein [Listeria monocytogenes]EAD9992088.1 hypothetical protein [Listeria monocytogenes]